MATPSEISERQRHLLSMLLRIKKANKDTTVNELQEVIVEAVSVMDARDISFVEKAHGIKAL